MKLKELFTDTEKLKRAVKGAINASNTEQRELMRKYEFVCHEAGKIGMSPELFLTAFDIEVCPCGYKGNFYNCPGYEAKPKGKKELKTAFTKQINANPSL